MKLWWDTSSFGPDELPWLEPHRAGSSRRLGGWRGWEVGRVKGEGDLTPAAKSEGVRKMSSAELSCDQRSRANQVRLESTISDTQAHCKYLAILSVHVLRYCTIRVLEGHGLGLGLEMVAYGT